MGRDNVIVNRWLSQKERFADLMNGCLFQGRQIVFPEHLERIDRESDILIPGKGGAGNTDNADRTGSRGSRSSRSVQRFRDIVMRWKEGTELAVLALENQERIHYAMPVRTMIYDGLSYADQIENRWQTQRQKGNRDEFLSRFQKTDRLHPVVTLVFYYGSKPWDGSRDLHGMIFRNGTGGENENLRKYIPNYRINLVDAERMKNTNVFQTDLQYVLNMIKCKNSKDKTLAYVEANRSYFQEMSADSYQALGVFLNSEKWLNKIHMPEGGTNMCRALEEIFEDGRDEGRREGRKEGKTDKLKEQISIKLEKGKSLEVIADELEESMGTIRFLMQEMAVKE